MNRSIRIRKGLDIPIAGAPEQVIYPGPRVRHVALCGVDYVGLKPRMLVDVGDSVGLGQALLEDKRDPVVCYGSPGRGTVVAINRGTRRVLESVVIRLGEGAAEDKHFDGLGKLQIEGLGRNRITERLLRSGLWTAFRTRPFSRVPLSDSTPRSIFVTAIDTRPLAPDPAIIVETDPEAFVAGLQVVTKLTQGTVWLCTAPDWQLSLPGIDRVQHASFNGPHPAGLPGTHMHILDPVGPDRTCWQVGYQDVMAIGRLFIRGVIDASRIVSLAGSCVKNPRLVKTRMGSSLEELFTDDVCGTKPCRIISGSVLGGRSATGALAYLGRYHEQVSVLPEGGAAYPFGWLGLYPKRFTAAPTFSRKSGFRRRYAFNTTQNGRYSGMMPMRVFDRIMPLDILPSPLLRALLVQDTERSQALGCLELDEEDLSLCSFVCPAKKDYGLVLRMNLDLIEKEG